jgi:hypothetical protein
MKLNMLGIGVPLSKEEQKLIKGGQPCMDPKTVECFCMDGNVETGVNPIQPIVYCEENVCNTLGGFVSFECV